MKRTVAILLLCFCSACVRHSTTFLIPVGYKGEVTIFYNQEKGQQMKFEDGRRLMTIPATGVLLTSFKDDKGFVNHQYYYVDGHGKRQRLRVYSADDLKNDKVISKNELGIFFDGTAGRYGAPVENLPYEWFIVSDFKSLDSISSNAYEDVYKQKLKEAIGYDFISKPDVK